MKKNKKSALGTKGHPKFCDGVGCFVQQEFKTEMGKKQWVTVLHCKALDKIVKKIKL